jgi:tetratricopeptide (TPR) repeat protein
MPLRLQSQFAQNLLKQARLQEAQDILRDVIEQQLSALELNQWDLGYTERRLGFVYTEQGHADDGISLLLSAVERLGAVLGRGNPDTLKTMEVLTTTYRQIGRISEAEALAREMATRREQCLRERDGQDGADLELEREWGEG